MALGWRGFRASVTAKVAVVAVLLLAMLIPLAMVNELIRERGSARALAAADVARAWGSAQTLGGPIVVVPFRYEIMDRQGVSRQVSDELYLLPRELTIEGGADMQVLSRGIYQIPVYSASLSITGVLRPVRLDTAALPSLEIDWSEAQIALPLTDAHALRSGVSIDVGGNVVEFGPDGAAIPGFGATLRAPLAGLDPARFGTAQPFTLELTLAGTGSLDFRPDGDTTRVAIESDWPSPSFRGGYLPDERNVAASGFDALWQVPALGRGYPASWRRSDHAAAGAIAGAALAPPAALTIGPSMPQPAAAPFVPAVPLTAGTAQFGVEFIVPVDVHTSSQRAIKYAALYLAVTFAAFFLFEIFANARLHPIQYLSIGLANGIFYLLLLALAEHAGFAPAYFASAIASTALIGGYSAAILGSTRRALPMTGLISGLYVYLYTTLRAEDFALLAGALGLFALLTAFMYLTRGVDWYALELAPPAAADGKRTDA